MHTADSTPLEVLSSRLEAVRSNLGAAEQAAKRGDWLELDHFLDKAGTKLVHASRLAQDLHTQDEPDPRRFLPAWVKNTRGGGS
jgi:hypothetical protein